MLHNTGISSQNMLQFGMCISHHLLLGSKNSFLILDIEKLLEADSVELHRFPNLFQRAQLEPFA
jgi:hypothetical protein